jgi:hypothetical protein
MNTPNALPPAAVVREKLAPLLGPFTAKNAVTMGAKQAFGTDADHVTREQIPALLEAIGPTLRTLLGKEGALNIVAQIKAELGIR